MPKTIKYSKSDIEKYQIVSEILGLEDLDIVDQKYDKETDT